MSAPSTPAWTMSPPGKSKLWVAVHWLVAVSPFILVVALSIWGYEKYWWIPLLAGVLCPVGAALVGLQIKRDRARARAKAP